MKTFNFALILTLFFTSLDASSQTIGIKKDEFISHYRVQKTMMWCWASCAEMVLSYEGINLSQEAIVTRVKGAPIPTGGNPYEMIKSTNFIVNDNDNNAVVISGQFVNGAPYNTVLYNQLKHKKPVILTYSTGVWSGHAIVLTGIDYILNPDLTFTINRFYVFDPFSYSIATDIMGNQYLKEDSTLSYKIYDLQLFPDGLHLISGMKNIGLVTGMIFIDASKLND
jgi:hypothetical protein